MNIETIKQIVSELLEEVNILKQEPEGTFNDGKMLAYNEILSKLKIYLTPLGVENFGLDIDIDKLFVR